MTRKLFKLVEAYPVDKLVRQYRDRYHALKEVSPPKTSNEMACRYCGESFGYEWCGAWACGNLFCEIYNETPEVVSGKTVPTYKPQIDQCNQPDDLKLFMKAYASNPHGFVVFLGDTGRGKSYLAEAIYWDSIKQHHKSATYWNVSDLYIEWLKLKKGGFDDDLIMQCCKCNLLVLDDLGIRMPTESFFDFIYVIINKRLNDDLGTLIITNCSVSSLAEKYGNALVSRMFSGKYFTFNANTNAKFYERDRRTEHHLKKNSFD